MTLGRLSVWLITFHLFICVYFFTAQTLETPVTCSPCRLAPLTLWCTMNLKQTQDIWVSRLHTRCTCLHTFAMACKPISAEYGSPLTLTNTAACPNLMPQVSKHVLTATTNWSSQWYKEKNNNMHCGIWLRIKTKGLFLDFFHRFTHFGHGCSITHVKRFSFLLCLDLIFCCDGGFSLRTHTLLPVQFVSCSCVKKKKKKMTHFHTRGN